MHLLKLDMFHYLILISNRHSKQKQCMFPHPQNVFMYLQDNDEKMAYEIAQHHNQHQCFRFLSSVHWARKTDDVELKRLKEEEMAKQNRRDNEKLCLQLKKERGTKAFSKWLFDKSFCTSKTEPKECAKRKKIRLTPNSSSTCTYCSTVACSRGHSVQSGSMKIAPIKITSHQEGRNLNSIGRPVKMLPYMNYPPKKHHTKKCRHSVSAKRSKKCCASGSHSKKPSQKKVNGKNVKNTEGKVSVLKKLSATECLSTDLVQRQMTGWNDEDNKDMSVKSLKQLHRSNSNNSDEFDELSKSYLPKDTSNDGDDEEEEEDDDYDDDGDDEDADEDEEEEEDDEDEDEDQEEEEDDEDEDDENKEDDSDDYVPIPFDDNDALPYPQLSFSVEDENNFFHEVGPMNDLNSLALPPVLTKGRTPAEVLQIIRHLEGSGSKATPRTRRSHSVSGYNSGRSRHFNRRLSLGSIPEGEILYNYNDGYTDADNDKVDSQVLLDLENLIGSISGREEEEENEHQENKERGDEHAMEKEERKEINLTVSLECELSTNMVHSEISCSPLLPPPSHKITGSSTTPSSDDTDDSNPTTPERRITPPSRKITPPSRASALFLSQASPSTQAHSKRLLSAPSTSQTSQRKRYISSAPPLRKISPPRKNTPPSRKSSPPMLPNAEVTLLSSSIQEMQEDDSVSGNSEMHDREAKTTGSNKCVVPMEQSAPSMKRRSTAPSLSLFAASGYSSPAQVSPSHSKSFSDPCMTYSPLNSPKTSHQRASFFIGDSDSSSSYSSSSEVSQA